MVSIVIPTYNEKENIKELLLRLKSILGRGKEKFEIVVVDDHSTDGSWETLQKEKLNFPLRIFKKQGKKGKAYSLVEGFDKTLGDILVMIDGDLQYPPEAISPMLNALGNADLVVANRKNYHYSLVRKALSRIFRFAFGRLLFGLDCDIQSGLKAFRREVYQTVKFAPQSPWTFDLEFLHRTKEAGFRMINVDITFHPRKNGNSKIEFFRTTFEIGLNALLLKFKRIHPQLIAATNPESMLGAGVGYRRKKYVTHTTLPYHQSAIRGFLLWQKTAIYAVFLLLALGFYKNSLSTAIVLVAVLSVTYFLDVIFNLFLIIKSLKTPPEIAISKEELQKVDEKDLPIYSILCPLYKEAAVLPQFVEAIDELDWPKEKLDVILLLEEDDKETQEVASKLSLAKYIRTLIIPHAQPKTKPKACNLGLAHAKGEYVVIFDAEDRPEPDQLKKAYFAFKKVPKEVVCLQAKLNYYNPHQNLLTKLFTAEYSLWFDVTLTGLQSINTTIPLGGTSNHFRTADLVKLQGWDPFNVTEDADLGVRLFKAGYKTAMIDSTTYEEANSKVGNWLRQRSRWIKGYMQTYLVHMRDPIGFIKTNGFHAFIFQLVVGGKIAFMFINPFLWVATISYFAFYSLVGPTIEALYPPVVFYMAATSLVFGNFMFMYYYMIGCAKRNHWQVVKYVFLVPFYWLMVSFGATIALYQLVFKPHFWEKTIHGFHLAKAKESGQIEEIAKEIKAVPGRFRRVKTIITAGSAAAAVIVAASLLGNLLITGDHRWNTTRANQPEDLIASRGAFFPSSNENTQNQSQTQTQKNDQTINVKAPTAQPEAGVSTLALSLMFSAAPLGVILRRFGREQIKTVEKREELSSTAISIARKRKNGRCS